MEGERSYVAPPGGLRRHTPSRVLDLAPKGSLNEVDSRQQAFLPIRVTRRSSEEGRDQ